jgi:hypothetical protein
MLGRLFLCLPVVLSATAARAQGLPEIVGRLNGIASDDLACKHVILTGGCNSPSICKSLLGDIRKVQQDSGHPEKVKDLSREVDDLYSFATSKPVQCQLLRVSHPHSAAPGVSG